MMNRFQLSILPQINIFTIDHRMDYHTSLDLYPQETLSEKVKRLPLDYGLHFFLYSRRRQKCQKN